MSNSITQPNSKRKYVAAAVYVFLYLFGAFGLGYVFSRVIMAIFTAMNGDYVSIAVYLLCLFFAFLCGLYGLHLFAGSIAYGKRPHV